MQSRPHGTADVDWQMRGLITGEMEAEENLLESSSIFFFFEQVSIFFFFYLETAIFTFITRELELQFFTLFSWVSPKGSWGNVWKCTTAD